MSTRARAPEANETYKFLSPSLTATTKLISELNADQRVFEDFLVKGSRTVSAIAERRDDLASLTSNGNRGPRGHRGAEPKPRPRLEGSAAGAPPGQHHLLQPPPDPRRPGPARRRREADHQEPRSLPPPAPSRHRQVGPGLQGPADRRQQGGQEQRPRRCDREAGAAAAGRGPRVRADGAGAGRLGGDLRASCGPTPPTSSTPSASSDRSPPTTTRTATSPGSSPPA